MLRPLLFALALLTASACAAPQETTPVVQEQASPEPSLAPDVLAFASEDAATALPRLVQAERNAAAVGDMATLKALWAEDATIIERREADNTDDDYTWQGRAAILDRYTVAVAQNRPTTLDTPPDAPVSVTGASATMVNGVDTWEFVFREGRWWILALEIAP